MHCQVQPLASSHTLLLSQSSIIWYRRKLGSKQAHHATNWPRVHGLAASAGVWFRVKDQCRPMIRMAVKDFMSMTISTSQWLMCISFYLFWAKQSQSCAADITIGHQTGATGSVIFFIWDTQCGSSDNVNDKNIIITWKFIRCCNVVVTTRVPDGWRSYLPT